MLCSALFCAVLCCAALLCVVLLCFALCCAVLFCFVLFCSALSAPCRSVSACRPAACHSARARYGFCDSPVCMVCTFAWLRVRFGLLDFVYRWVPCVFWSADSLSELCSVRAFRGLRIVESVPFSCVPFSPQTAGPVYFLFAGSVFFGCPVRECELRPAGIARISSKKTVAKATVFTSLLWRRPFPSAMRDSRTSSFCTSASPGFRLSASQSSDLPESPESPESPCLRTFEPPCLRAVRSVPFSRMPSGPCLRSKLPGLRTSAPCRALFALRLRSAASAYSFHPICLRNHTFSSSENPCLRSTSGRSSYALRKSPMSCGIRSGAYPAASASSPNEPNSSV